MCSAAVCSAPKSRTANAAQTVESIPPLSTTSTRAFGLLPLSLVVGFVVIYGADLKGYGFTGCGKLVPPAALYQSFSRADKPFIFDPPSGLQSARSRRQSPVPFSPVKQLQTCATPPSSRAPR